MKFTKENLQKEEKNFNQIKSQKTSIYIFIVVVYHKKKLKNQLYLTFHVTI